MRTLATAAVLLVAAVVSARPPGEVGILRDRWGVPHIFTSGPGASERSAYANGYMRRPRIGFEMNGGQEVVQADLLLDLDRTIGAEGEGREAGVAEERVEVGPRHDERLVRPVHERHLELGRAREQPDLSPVALHVQVAVDGVARLLGRATRRHLGDTHGS
jgi:hypothetical protein